MSNVVFVLNGPNLNLLGTREPEIYGTQTLGDVERLCKQTAQDIALEIDFRQTNHEGVLIDWLQEAGTGSACGVVLNPAAYTHTSLALQDTIKSISVPIIEVHLSNPHAREDIRKTSFISCVAKGVVCGFGVHGYVMALYGLKHSGYIRQVPK